jgi:hemoglobin-like flavoprotein
MTSEADAALITDSLAAAAERGGDLTGAVYKRLFRERPDLEALFILDKNGAVRGEMLSRAFDAILDFVGPRLYAHNLIGAEATTHEGYLVPRDAFAMFFAIVRDVVREASGPHWSGPTEEAWRRLLADIAGYITAPSP